MIIFLKCKCGESLISINRECLFKKNNITIINNDCYIQCPCCNSTSFFSKKSFSDFFKLNSPLTNVQTTFQNN